MALLRDMRWARGLLLVSAALAAVMLLLAQDSRPASAVNTRVYFTYSTTNPSPQSNIILNPDGAPVTLYVWAENITDPQGLASFSVDVIYDPDLMSVPNVSFSDTFLESTGRQAMCTTLPAQPVPGDPDHYYVNAACASIVTNPPAPPVQGSGLLATLTVVPGSDYGMAALTNDSFMMDAGYIIPPDTVVNPEQIAATVISATAQIAKCGDVAPPPNGDGAVSGLDFFSLLTKFGTSQGLPGWDERYDLNGDGAVAGVDFFILLGQFGALCTQ